MNIPKNLLDILVCPITKQKLVFADVSIVNQLNKKIARGELVNQAAKKVRESVEAILVRADGNIGYLVRDGIPILLEEEAVALDDMS